MIATWMDVFGVLILSYNVLRGLTTGLIRTSVGAIAVVIATYAAWQHQGLVAPFVDAFVPPTWSLALFARPVLTWVLAFIAVNVFGSLLRLTMRLRPLVVADRIGGAVFGLMTGVVVLATPLVLLAHFPLLQQIPQLQEAIAHSVIAGAIKPLLTAVQEWAPVINGGQFI
ncbi:CvpA family protein [bacterium]|nr:CvpA family protein [bacterium]